MTHYRAYDPSVGRWLNRDPIEESGGLNLYGYVGGNPVSNTDPYGLFEWPSLPESFVDFWRGYGSYYGGLGNAASHMWRRSGAAGDCEKQRAIEDEAILATALLSLSDPRISKKASAAAQKWASNHKSYIGGRLSAGVVTSGVTGVGIYGGISLGTTAVMGDALHNISLGADNPEQVLLSIMGDKMSNLPNIPKRPQCRCEK